MDAFAEAAVLGLETTRIGVPGTGLVVAFALGNFVEAVSSASGMEQLRRVCPLSLLEEWKVFSTPLPLGR